MAHQPLLSIPSSQESRGRATSLCARAADTCFERQLKQIVVVLGHGQELLGTRTQRRTQGRIYRSDPAAASASPEVDRSGKTWASPHKGVFGSE